MFKSYVELMFSHSIQFFFKLNQFHVGYNDQLAYGKQEMQCSAQVYTQTTLSVCTTTLNRFDFELLDLHIGDAILNVPFLLNLQVMYLHRSSFHRCHLVSLCQ